MKNSLKNKGISFYRIKFDLKMKLTIYLFIATLFQVQANSYSQNTKISLNLENVSVEEVLREIESQTEFKILYNDNEVDYKRIISVNFNKERISNILEEIFENYPITYEVLDKQIILKKTLEEIKSPDKKEDAVIQTKEISGKVSDLSGLPLPGVSILVVGTTIGTQTDFDGNFVIEANEGDVLQFSFIGMKTQQVTIGAENQLTITLEEDASALDEVVVTGYGTQKKANLTGAVSSVDSELLESRPITNASTALQGTASGVYVNQNSGQAGRDDVTIRIRGVGTLSDSNPLILIDGIEAPLSNINSEDIENITVLKDAASASIYGSRAANGVVLVTTKRGHLNGPPKFTYSGYYGVQEAIRLPEMVNDPVLFATLRNQASENFGNGPLFTPEQMAEIESRSDQIATNWVDEVFTTAPIQQHTLDVSGGSEKTNFRFAFGYLNQEGTMIESDYSRLNSRFNLDTRINKKFKIGTSLSFTRGDRNSPSSNLADLSSPFGQALQATPLYPVKDDQGRYASFSSVVGGYGPNPVAGAMANDYNSIDLAFLGSVYFEYNPIEDLTIIGTFATNYQGNDSEGFGSQIGVHDFVTGDQTDLLNNPRWASKGNAQQLNTTMWFTATYVKSFKDHNFKLLAGYNQEESIYKSFGAGRTGFLSDNIRVLDVGDASTATNYGSETGWSLRSYFGRLNYNWKEKYLFEANIRVDGSSRFLNDKWGTFPSFSAGWVLSQEDFLKDSKSIDFLKIRASWGQLGNQNVGNFAYSKQLSLTEAYTFGGSVVSGVAQTTLGNPDLTWETTTSTDIGINLGMFNFLTLEADYFVRTTEDILFDLPISVLSGFTTLISNASTVQNKGWELGLNYNDNFGDWNVSAGFNVTHVDSEVTELNPGIDAVNEDRVISGRRITQRGSPLNSFYGLRSIGIFQSQEEIDSAPDHTTLNPNFGPGDLRFEDVNDDGIINDLDRVIIGKENPTWFYGFNFRVEYKGFDIAGLFQGAADFNGYAGEEIGQPFFNNAGLWSGWEDAWTPENTNTSTPRLFVTDGPSTAATNSHFILDRSYLRFKNLQFGYTFNSETIGETIDNLRLFVNGTNLFTSTDYPFLDPERPPGADRGGSGYPNSRVITAGLTISF